MSVASIVGNLVIWSCLITLLILVAQFILYLIAKLLLFIITKFERNDEVHACHMGLSDDEVKEMEGK